MTPQELKASILWNAIQGKLTKQMEGESVEDLLGGLSLSQIAEEECYFDIPSNWKWCKIKDVFTLVNGKAFKPTDWGQSGLPIVRIQNLNDFQAPFNYYAGEIEDKYLLNGGELLFSWSGTPGTSFGSFIWSGGTAVLNQHIFIVYPRFHIDTKYAMYALNGELKVFIDKAHGGAGLKHITKKEFENCGLPIPPLAEQKRIVAKIEELLPYIDRYEQAWSKLEDFNKRFPVDMQKSILQMAIQGKLVDQRPEEGTGEELYQQIQAEKQRLIKAGTIKKEKPLPEITEDEIPFDTPDTWKWVRVGNIGSWSAGATPSRTQPDFYGGNIPWLKTGDLTDGYVSDIPETITDLALEKTSVRLNPVGSVLMAMYGATIGKLGILQVEATTNQACCACIPYAGMWNKYLFYFLMANRRTFIKMGEGGAQPNISKEKIVNALMPLPPLAEQKRIVAKLEEILPLCDRLK